MNEDWKLFYLGVDVTMSAQAGVGIFVSPRLAHCVTDWIPLGGKVCLLKLRLQERSLCILQVYVPNPETQYHSFLDKVGVALQKVTSAESIVLLVISMHMCVLTTRHGRVLLEDKETLTLTQTKGFCCSSVPPMNCIMNTFFRHKELHKYTWYRDSVGQRSIIDFCIVSTDLLLWSMFLLEEELNCLPTNT